MKNTKKVQIIFKNGVIKEYYNVMEINNFMFEGKSFFDVVYKPFDGFKRNEFYRLSEIASWQIEESTGDKDD